MTMHPPALGHAQGGDKDVTVRIYVSVNGSTSGPFTEADILRQIHAGQLRDALIAPEGSAQWAPLYSHPPFAHALQAVAQSMGAQVPLPHPAGPANVPPAMAPHASPAMAPHGPQAMAPHASPAMAPHGPQAMAPNVPAARAQGPAARTGPPVKLIVGLIGAGVLVVGAIVVVLIFVLGKKEKKGGDVTIAITEVEVFGDDLLRITLRTGPDAQVKVTSASSDIALTRCWDVNMDIGNQRCEFDIKRQSYGKHVVAVDAAVHGGGKAHAEAPFEKRRGVEARSGLLGLDLTCRGAVCSGYFRDSGKLELDVAAGTKVNFAGLPTATSTGKVVLAADLSAEVLKAPLDQIVDSDKRSKYKFSVPLRLTFGDGVVIEEPLQATGSLLQGWLAERLKEVERGPVRFAGEADGPVGRRSLFLAQFIPRFLGTGSKATDIDLVAVVAHHRSEHSCGMYRNSKGDTAAYLVVRLDHTYTVFERRTGKRVANKRFAAPPLNCPGKITRPGTDLSEPSAYDVDVWFKTLLK